MSYEIAGKSIETDANGYLTNAQDWTEEVGQAIAQAESLNLDERAWDIVKYLRDEYFNKGGNQPNDRNIVKAMSKLWGEKINTKVLYNHFPGGPSKQAGKVGGLPESRRKGGY